MHHPVTTCRWTAWLESCLTDKLTDWYSSMPANFLNPVLSRCLAGLLSDRYCSPTSRCPQQLSNWQTDWLVYHLTGCWFTCLLYAKQINFKESSSFSSRELRPISRKKTNYHQEPWIQALAGHLDFSCSTECDCISVWEQTFSSVFRWN